MALFGLIGKKMSLLSSGVLKGTSDRHSHILYGVDDGVKTLEEALDILKYEEEAGICGCCTKWDTKSHGTSKYNDFGTCLVNRKSTHRYDCCEHHSKTNGGWGL